MSHPLCGAICAGVTALSFAVTDLSSHADVCVELVAEKTLTVGRVCVAERSDTLFVRFVAEGSWRLTETHLAVSPELAGIPLAGGRQPILGRFPYKDAHVPAVTEFVIALPFSRQPSLSGATLVVAAHASVAHEGTEEGAWAKGPAFSAEGSPATYFLYRRTGSKSPD